MYLLVTVSPTETTPKTMREATIDCEQNPDALESGADEKPISIEACAKRILSSTKVPKFAKEICGDLVGRGWAHMPDVADYVLSKPGADKLGYGSECDIGSLVFSQCWLEPRLTVKQAIDLAKARAGKKLPDTPVCACLT